MEIDLLRDSIHYKIDLNKGTDISIPLVSGQMGPNCFYAPLFEVKPVKSGSFVGSTLLGGSVNFMNIHINPHGNGTHTECVGHITKDKYTINNCLKQFHFVAELISVFPRLTTNGDKVITKDSLLHLGKKYPTEALIIRTLPNHQEKTQSLYSGTNPTYFDPEAIELINDWGVIHLLTDLPSIDREEDGGKLASHKTFWGVPNDIKREKTITEMIFVPNEIKDGMYFINIQIISLESDASPSKIMIYPMKS